VIQGYGADLTWEQLNEAAIAIQRGAYWLATNTDPTRPTDRGLVPGNGAAVAAVRTAVDIEPEVAGKPYPPLITETLRRIGAERAIFVGDRFDTDIAGAVAVGLDSLFVLSGSCGVADLLAAGPGERPTHIGFDLSALLGPPRTVRHDDEQATCGRVTARLRDGSIAFETTPNDREEGLDALAALASLAWSATDRGAPAEAAEAIAALGRLRSE
jgi:hypothetical protein